MTDCGNMKPDLTEIKRALEEKKGELAAKYKVKSLGIFGSYVRDEADPSSDLDILVEFYEAPGLIDFLSLENYLSDLLGLKVDLVMRRALKPLIGERILSEVVPV